MTNSSSFEYHSGTLTLFISIHCVLTLVACIMCNEVGDIAIRGLNVALRGHADRKVCHHTPTYQCESLVFVCTMEPLLKDSPNKGHHRNYLPTKDTL